MSITEYSPKQIWLHWTIAILIFTQFVLHEGIVAQSEALEQSQSISPTLLAQSHVVFGLLIFVFAALRVYLRFTQGAPATPDNEPVFLRFLAKATHVALYAVMLLMPISGSVAWFGGVDAAKAGHNLGKTVMLVFVLLHVAGAVYQHFILKTDVMRRILPTVK
jgi:cytochrome b561